MPLLPPQMQVLQSHHETQQCQQSTGLTGVYGDFEVRQVSFSPKHCLAPCVDHQALNNARARTTILNHEEMTGMTVQASSRVVGCLCSYLNRSNHPLISHVMLYTIARLTPPSHLGRDNCCNAACTCMCI